MLPAVSYIPYDTTYRGGNDNIITFAHFKEGILLSETCNNTKSGNKAYENSNRLPLIIEEEMDVMSSGDESDAEPMSKDMLEDFSDGNQSHTIINSI